MRRGEYLTRALYSTIVRSPPKTAPREVPTPLVFLSAKEWDPKTYNGVTYLSSMLAEKGYTCMQTDLARPARDLIDSIHIMRHFESELIQEIRLSMIPFPPVVFATSSACLIAQTYISSHPASGLFMISPPTSNKSVSTSLLPSHLPEFSFEPKFPIGIMGSTTEIKQLKSHHRLGDSPGVDMIPISDVEGPQALAAVESWLDELGI